MSSSDNSKTLLVIVTGLAVLFLIFKGTWFLYAAVAIGLLAILFPVTGNWIVYLWNKLAIILGWINSKILLTLIFFVFLFPIAMLARLFSKNTMNLKPVKGQSVYIERNHKYVKEDMENIW